MAITKPDDLLVAVKAGLDAATPGDWYWDSRNGKHYLCTANPDNYVVVLGWPCGLEEGTFFTEDERGAADADLIENAPTWLRALLDRCTQSEQREESIIASWGKATDEWMARALKAEAEAAAYRAAILSEAGQPAHDPEWWTVDRVVSLAKAHASDSIQADAFEESRDKAEAERGDINRMMDLAEIAEDPCVPCRVAACVTALNAARSDLAINAKLLSRQMDLARQAEIEARDARAEAAHYQELWKCRDDECRDLRDEIKRCQKSTGTFRRTLLAVRDRYRAGDTIEAIAADYDWLPEDVVELLDGLIPD